MRTGYNCSAPSPPNYVSNDTREQRCARPVIAVFFPAITVQNRAREKARETRRAKRAKRAKAREDTFSRVFARASRALSRARKVRETLKSAAHILLRYSKERQEQFHLDVCRKQMGFPA